MLETPFPYLELNSQRAANPAAPLVVLPQGEQSAYDLACVAYPDQTLTFSAHLARKSGITRVEARLWREDALICDRFFDFTASEKGIDLYQISISLSELLEGRTDDFLQYEIRIWQGNVSHATCLHQNGAISWERECFSPLRLLVISRDFSTPDWLKNGTMYHIFVDRFAKGSGFSQYPQSAVLNPDWENGIPPYAKRAGDPLDNNVFFGGNLWGIIEHLDDLEQLGVTILYLSPIFRAYSNHKYDTGDYFQVDDAFGGDAALRALLDAAHARGMRVILDGVFNHTGDDSRYFNRYGNYDSVGAYQSPQSPYADWYRFRSFPDDYESWWGIKILPRLNPASPSCREYFLGKDGVIAHYLKMGIDGWRLDVADELSDDFLDGLRAVAKETNPQSAIIGEVWENAVTKVSYGYRRKYFRGSQLDSVMNYPFRVGILDYIRNQNAQALANPLNELYHDYPRCASDALMNLIGTHDTERTLTLLGEDRDVSHCSNDDFARWRLTEEGYARGAARLKLASAVQYTVYGFPSLFYADEVGMQGYHDPFCRLPYPWHRKDTDLLAHYRKLGQIRRQEAVFCGGDFRILCADRGLLAYERTKNGERIVIAANCGDPRPFALDGEFLDLYTNTPWQNRELCENEFVILKECK